MKFFTIWVVLTLYFVTPAVSQECGVDDVNFNMMRTSEEYRNDRKNLEEWTRNFINQENSPLFNNAKISKCDMGRVFTIPVVVHVIHLGESIGTGSNISDDQIHQAIDMVNYRFANLNGISQDIGLKFELAKRDTNGNATTGIVRVNGSSIISYVQDGIITDGTAGSNALEVKNLSIWPRDKYYNIWVVHDIQGNTAGYAFYPTSYKHEGAVMDYRYMTASSITLTHELGHAFNLKHTFEGDNDGKNCPTDNDCELDGDLVCDTPPHKRSDCSSTTCGSSEFPFTNTSQNIMSYCYDRRHFTYGQKLRMRAAIFSSYRFSLVESDALIPPVLNNDIELISLNLVNNSSLCDQGMFELELKNNGTQNISSISARLTLNEDILNGDFPLNPVLQAGQSRTYTFSTDPPLKSGAYNVLFEIEKVNGEDDDYNQNNFICGEYAFSGIKNDDVCYDFEEGTIPEGLYHSDYGEIGFRIDSLNTCSSNGDYVLVYDQWNKITNLDLNNEIVLPPLNDADADGLALIYDRAYARTYSFYSYTTLNIDASTDCGSSYTNIKSMKGSNLISTAATYPSVAFVPQSCEDWKRDTVSLDDYIHQNSFFRMKFTKTAGTKDNDVYLDNICIAKKYLIKVSSDVAEGTVSGGGLFYKDESITLTASPQSGYSFNGWYENGKLVSVDENYKFSVSERRSLTAKFNTATSVKNSQNFSMNVYPNPAQDILFLNFETPHSVDINILIRDVQGRILETYSYPKVFGKNTYSFPLDKFSKGMYILELHSPEGMNSLKFIIAE